MNVQLFALALAAGVCLFSLYAWLVVSGHASAADFVSDLRTALLTIAGIFGAGHLPGRFLSQGPQQ